MYIYKMQNSPPEDFPLKIYINGKAHTPPFI